MKLPKSIPNTLSERRDRVYIIPTRFGVLFASIVLLLLTLGTIFENSSLLISSAILVTFGLICMHQTHFNIAEIDIESVEPPNGFSGTTAIWRLKIKNRAPATAFSISVLDDLIDCPARETSAQTASLHLKERGGYKMTAIKVSSTYPLGLFYSWKNCTFNLKYYVYPALGKETTLPRAAMDKRDDNQAQEDFIGHREYVPGDSAHRIDWKVQARRQKLLIKLFESQNPDEVLLSWADIKLDNVEEKLSVLARAAQLCFQGQKTFSLEMPTGKLGPGYTSQHLESCLKMLATYGGRDNVDVA